MKRILPLLLVAACSQAVAGPVFNAASYNASVSFANALGGTTMTMAYDGMNYYSTSGGSTSGVRLAKYTGSGVNTNTYSPGLDFRSVFADNSGNVLARGFNNKTIYKQSSPGVFSATVALAGSIDAQSSVDMNDLGQYVANSQGTIGVWDASGAMVSSFSLINYNGGGYPANRGVAAAGNYLLTYNSGSLSAWNYAGQLLDTAVLNAAGTSFASNFSLSYANNRVFINNGADNMWRGYDLGLAQSNPVPEPASLALIGLALAGLVARRRKRA